MDYTNRFDGKGEIYAKARPKYAAGLLYHLKNTLNIPEGSVFADIGSGTGIFTGQLLGCGYKVFAVEPNADMRKKPKKSLGEIMILSLWKAATATRVCPTDRSII